MSYISWEEAVKRLRSIPDQADLVMDAYLDEDNLAAAKRFLSSREFDDTLFILNKNASPPPWDILDIGAGNGIATYAFAEMGNKIFSLEPDPSSDIGAGAIQKLKETKSLNVEILESSAENIPLQDNAVDIVYIRQALHHADNLSTLLGETYRVLKHNGLLLATREHVVNNERQLKLFLEAHPLHKWYGGEHAYTLKEYSNSIRNAGFRLKKVLGPYETPINYAPMKKDELIIFLTKKFKPLILHSILQSVLRNDILWRFFAKALTIVDKSPGRLFSFLAQKPSLRDSPEIKL